MNVQLAKKRKETLEKTDAQDTDTTKTDTKESFEIDEAARIPTQHGNVYDSNLQLEREDVCYKNVLS